MGWPTCAFRESAWPTCAFRESAYDISEGRKSVGFNKSAEGISRALAESQQFPNQNWRLFGTARGPFSEFHGTDNRKNAPKSLRFDASRVERISTRWNESVGALHETGSDMTVTPTFPLDSVSRFPSGDEAEVMVSTAVWIGAGSSLAAVLMVIVVIVLLVGCRTWSLKSAADATESDMETNIPGDGEVSSTAVDPFLSEENALSVDRKIRGELADDFSEGAVRVLPSDLLPD
jgi:hypothetical protein